MGNQAIALQHRVGADQEIGHHPLALAAARTEATLHLAGAQGRLGLQRIEADAHVFQHRQRLGAVAQRAAHFGQHDVAHHDRPGTQALAQTGFGSVCLRTVGQQVHQHRGIDGNHAPASGSNGSPGARPRMARIASSVLSKPSSLKRPRAREIASSTLLRRMMRPFQLDLERSALGQPKGIAYRLGQRDLAALGNGGFHGRSVDKVCTNYTYFGCHTQARRTGTQTVRTH